jgi:hypothetical protein
MKSKKTARRFGVAPSINNRFDCCALHVVVYRAPGPDDSAIKSHAASVATRHSACRTHGGLGYVTLVESDFDRLQNGVERGDALGTAYSVLVFLGPGAKQFIGREDDFIYGWIGTRDESWGDVLLLEVIPRPHLLMATN